MATQHNKSKRKVGKTSAATGSKPSTAASQGKKGPMPLAVDPMLCTLTKSVIADPDYVYEIKWDGYRIVSFVKAGKVRMDSRGGQDYTARYPRIGKALKDLGHDIVLDGEAVVFNEQGLPDFDALQLYNGKDTEISYCVFDMLWLDGYNLMELPLQKRKAMLAEIIGDHPVLKVSESFEDGKALYEQMIERNLEGIVAKRRDSAYHPGQRGNDWLKTPTRKRQEFVIGGWAESEKSRAFRSLLFGAYKGKKLEWIGRSGGGYKEKEMPAILKKLQALETHQSPFENKVLDTKGATIHWVEPKLVAIFEFATWTKSGRIRKPATFISFRSDKKPGQVVREIPKAVEAVEQEVQVEKDPAPAGKQAGKLPKAMAASNWPAIEKQSRDEAGTIDIGDCTVDLYNVGRQIWKGVPKAQLIQYYHSVAPFILPHLKDRPQSLHIKLNGAVGPGLYIKDMEGRQPDCASIFTDKRRHPAKGKRSQIDYLVCNNEATLLWMINLGCIDINPWNSRVLSAGQPDYLVIDLDPTVKDEKASYLDKLLDTAMATKNWCDEHKIKAYVKTSGKTGIHFYVPCSGFDYPAARALTEQICKAIHALAPGSSTTENSIAKRGDLVYVDPSQNDYADTLAAPYSVRPNHIPTVSTPLEWKEINRKLNPHRFTIDEVGARLKKKGDLFAGILDKKTAALNAKILAKIF